MMKRVCAVLLFLAVPCLMACGQELPRVELTLSPRGIESPLLKYRLLPAEHELVDGDAAPILLRLVWDQHAYMGQVVTKFSEYLTYPLDDSRVIDAGNRVNDYNLSEIRRAARRKDAHWEYPLHEEPLGDVLLPDIQGFRDVLDRGLSVWIRGRIAQGRIDEALGGVQSGLAVNRHIAKTPFVIIQLSRAAANRMLADRLEELLGQPECPNLYWALTDLPRPFMDLRPSNEFEVMMFERTVEGAANLDLPANSPQWEIIFDRAVTQGLTSSLDREQLRTIAIRESRSKLPELIDGGEGRVAEMSDAEAAVRWFKESHERMSHRVEAAMSLDPPVAIPMLRELQYELMGRERDYITPSSQQPLPETGILILVADRALHTFCSVHEFDRRVAALRVVEAIRHHAAAHDGALPASLDEIDARATPIPRDPFTDRPFGYEVANGTATLTAPGIELEGTAKFGRQYVITVRK